MAVSSNMGNWMTYSQWMASTKSTKSPPSGHPWRSRRALRKKTTKLVHETGKFQVLKFFHILLTATAACCLKFLSNFESLDFRRWLKTTAQRHKHQPQTSTSEPSLVSRKSRIHTELHWDGPTSWQFGSHVETSAGREVNGKISTVLK